MIFDKFKVLEGYLKVGQIYNHLCLKNSYVGYVILFQDASIHNLTNYIDMFCTHTYKNFPDLSHF